MVLGNSGGEDAAVEGRTTVLRLFLNECARPEGGLYAFFRDSSSPDGEQRVQYVCSSHGAFDAVQFPSEIAPPPGDRLSDSDICVLPSGVTVHDWVEGLPNDGFAAWQRICLQDEWSGYLILWRHAESAGSEKSPGYLSAASEMVTTLLEAWQGESERFRSLLRLVKALQGLCVEVSSREDLDQILLKTCEAVASSLGFAEIRIYVLDEARGALRGTWGMEASGQVSDLSGASIVLEDYHHPLARLARGEIDRWTTFSAGPDQVPTAVLSLRAGGDVVGAVTVSNHHHQGPVTEAQLHDLFPLVAHAASTIQATIIRERLHRQNERADEMAANRKSFERDMILSVTDGKLNLCGKPDIKARLGEPVLLLSLTSPVDVSRCRKAVSQAAFQAGMSAERKGDFDLCVGEAATNCIQHGGGGHLELYRSERGLQVRVCDQGPGIHSSLLPRATLLKGYSTKTSLGVGFSVILSLCDHLYLSTSEHGTEILLEMSMEQRSEADLLWEQLGLSMDAVA